MLRVFLVEDESTISEIGIAWEKNTPKGAAFEIQVSAGGGQFLTVLSDKVKETGQLVNYNLKGKNTASDVRIVLGADKMGVTEVKKVGTQVKQGEPLLMIHYNDETNLDAAIDYFRNAYRLAPRRPTPPPIVVERVA